MRKTFEITMLLTILVLLSACDYKVQGGEVSRYSRIDPDAPAIFDSDGSAELDTQSNYEYYLGPKDKIRVEVERHDEFTFEATVDGDGTVIVPLLHEKLDVNGKSRKQVAADISWRIRKFVRQEPEVRVEVLEVHSKKYLVLGQVGGGGQGFMQMKAEETRLVDVLVDAAIMTNEDADVRQVYVIRPHRYRPSYVVIDAERVLMGRMEDNILIHDGDIVFVPTKLGTKIDRVVDYLLKRSGQVLNLDSDFQYYEDLFPKREVGSRARYR